MPIARHFRAFIPASVPVRFVVTAMVCLLLETHSLEAVQILKQEGAALNQSAVDDLNGRVGIMSAPLHPTSYGGTNNAAAFCNATSTTAPSQNIFWHPDGVAYHITWDLGTNIPPSLRQLDTVAINIDSHDPGRKGFYGSLSVSSDGVQFTEIPGTLYKNLLVQAGTGTSPLFNNITYAFEPGEVVGFRYLRLNSFDDTSINLLQPRYVEVDAFTSRVPGGSSRPTFWSIRNGRFYVDDQWVFLKSGKLLRAFGTATSADPFIADINVMIDQLHYNHVALNIYPDQFDTAADGRVATSRLPGLEVIKRLIDHCWARGVFVSLSFETYNVGGGGVPSKLFQLYPDMVATNALLEEARDIEYGGANGKQIPSIHHPRYLKWSRDFIRNFLRAIGDERASQLLYVETTVEPQYLGRNNVDADQRRAALDYSESARLAFEAWKNALPVADPRRAYNWPTNQTQRDSSIGNSTFNQFRGDALGRWVTGDIQAIRSVVSDVYIAVDYNNRFDDPNHLRMGDPDTFLGALEGANVIQVAPHAPAWGATSWNDVQRVNNLKSKGWAISEHMTANGGFPASDSEMTSILTNTLARGTRWGWDFVNLANDFPNDIFDLYQTNWTSTVLDVIEGTNWNTWLGKIGVSDFTPPPRSLPSYYTIWRERYFTTQEQTNENVSGWYADPGNYGVPNLLRYALGLNPRTPANAKLAFDVRPIVNPGTTNEYLSVSYSRNRMAREVQVEIEASENLTAWEVLSPTNIVSRTPQGEYETVVVRDSFPIRQSPMRYLRLRAEATLQH
jgi:hypothetical protein